MADETNRQQEEVGSLHNLYVKVLQDASVSHSLLAPTGMANATTWFVHFSVLEFHSNSAVIAEFDYIRPNENNYCIVWGLFCDGLTHIY